jgi:hypothetical protein
MEIGKLWFRHVCRKINKTKIGIKHILGIGPVNYPVQINQWYTLKVTLGHYETLEFSPNTKYDETKAEYYKIMLL